MAGIDRGSGVRRAGVPAQPAASAAGLTNQQLLHRCREGDLGAWDALVTRYERLVYSVARRNGLSMDDAADVTQSTFLSLVESIDRLQDGDRLASWLMTVARRQAWRARATARLATPVEDLPDETIDPFADWATLTTLHDSLSALGGTCRELLIALYLDPDEPSYEKIARRFGRAVGGIGPLRGRCLARLRALMAEGGWA